MKDLVDGGVFTKIKQGVKILGRGAKEWNIPLKIEVSSISERAKEAIIKAGGQVTTAYYNKVGLRYLLQVFFLFFTWLSLKSLRNLLLNQRE